MVHLIITSANIPQAYLFRKGQYINSFESCLKHHSFFDSYSILESYSKEEDYLKPYKTYYSKEGNPYLNKGLNEMNHIKAYLEQSTLSDNDTIIKLSGRYIVESAYFFEKVSTQHKYYDSFFKDDNDIYEGKGYHTFLFAIKKYLLLEIINKLEFSNSNEIPIEWNFKSHLQNNERNCVVDRLSLIAYQGTYAEKIFRC